MIDFSGAPSAAPKIQPLPPGSLEVITTHVNADFDAVASMIAAGRLYPNATMVFPGSQEKNIRNFYVQSVIYLFNVSKVKDIDLDQVRRLILVDTRNPSRIGPLQGVLNNENLSIHIYDHHPEAPGDLRGELEVISEVGANATIMSELLADNEMMLTPDEATVLAMGIYEDTGSFTFRSTTPRDFKAAARLLEQGADLNVVGEIVSRELTIDQVALLNEMIKSATIHSINGVEIMLTQAVSERYVDEVAVLVNKLMDMKNVHVMFALAHMDGRIYMVARSRLTQVDVGEAARHFGGGGHAAAAAATIKDLTLTQAAARLIRVLTHQLGPMRLAGDIMVYPVISVRPDNTLTEARDLLVRYSINVLLVVDEKGELQGFISRQNVSKAMYHGLPGYPVSEFMTTEFEPVSPKTPLHSIQSLVVEQKQRIVPVVDEGKVVGVITRTDLLNILASELGTSIVSPLEDRNGFPAGRRKKILNLMRERLSRDIVDLLGDIGRIAGSLGYKAFAVGGFVRDLILRRDNLDIDIVVEGDAIIFTEAFARRHPSVRVRQHAKFNTAVLVFPNDFKVDVTTARLEYYEHPAALPVVQGGSIRLDLYRRDFTINTLAISLDEKDFGTVFDFYRGLKDLKEGFIRVLHNLSFVEDPTRVFRAIRFEQRFRFRIGKLTANLIDNAVKNDFFLKLSGKRLAQEIRLILMEEDPAPAVERLAQFDLLKFIHPGITADQRLLDTFRRIKKIRDWFDLTFYSEKYQSWLVYFRGMLDNLTRIEAAGISDRLSLTKKEKKVLVDEKKQAEEIVSRLNRQKELPPSKIYTFLKILSVESILFIMARTAHEESTRLLAAYFTRIKNIRTELDGNDLIRLGYQPGPGFREVLDALLLAKLDGKVHDKSEEEDFVRKNFKVQDPPGTLLGAA